MCPKQGLEPCLKHLQTQRERQNYILLACGKVGTPGCVNKRAGEKRVCGRFRSEYAYGQQARPQVADIEELEEMDAPELHARRLNAKEVLTPMKGDNFIFPVADGTVNIFGRDRRLETIHLNQGSPWTRTRTISFSTRIRRTLFSNSSSR